MRRLLVLAVGMSLALTACAEARNVRGSAPDTAPTDGACGAPVAIPEGLIRPGRIVIFGEIHGVRELPGFFGDAVCTIAASALPVQVGLEIPRGEQDVIDRFLASAGSTADVTALIASPFWSRPYQDGRSSRAMLDLLDRLRRMRSGGMPVEVFAFDVDPGADGVGRDRAMARTAGDRARSRSDAVTLVLVGEVHSWKTRGSPWDPDFLPMGWHLVEDGLDVRSLGRATPAGRAWICTSASVSDCGPRDLRAYDALPGGGAEGIELLPEPSDRGYDGMYGTASLTESPPASKLPADEP